MTLMVAVIKQQEAVTATLKSVWEDKVTKYDLTCFMNSVLTLRCPLLGLLCTWWICGDSRALSLTSKGKNIKT